jgi:hypothetical protein
MRNDGRQRHLTEFFVVKRGHDDTHEVILCLGLMRSIDSLSVSDAASKSVFDVT